MRILSLTVPIASTILFCSAAAGQAIQAPAIVRQAVQVQLDDYGRHAWGLQYRVHRVDSKDDTIREVVESSDGNISRTLTWHGKPLTTEEEAGERTRLEALRAADVQRRRQKSESNDKYAVELIRAMPDAMLYTPVEGQPQLSGVAEQQTVLDFVPNPAFHPASTAQSLLTGLAGRIWIDSSTHHLLRIDLRIIKNLNLMFGILARVYEGGTLSYEQRPVAAGHDCYTRISMDVKLRELMLRTAPFRQTQTVTNIRFLPAAPSTKEAVNMLLAVPKP